jgi:transcriptional regulator with XRE-family HTH domain
MDRRGRKSTGGKLARERIKRDWTQEEAARRMHTTRSMLSLFETGRKMPTLSTLRSMRAAFGVTFDTLNEWLEDAVRTRARSRRKAA